MLNFKITLVQASIQRVSQRLELLQSVRSYLAVKASSKILKLYITFINIQWYYRTNIFRTQQKRLTLLHRRAESVIRNNKLDKIKTIITKESYLFVKKCIVKKLNKNIFDNYFEKLSHNNGT